MFRISSQKTASVPLVVALSAAAAASLMPGVAAAQPDGSAAALTTPAAPPPGPLAFDVPLYPWYLREVTNLKAEFIQVLAAEVMALGEAGIEGDVQSIAQGARAFSGVGERLVAAMAAIGNADPSFGIPDVSQLLPVEGAVRDTIFGFVAWHESSASESRKTSATLKRRVGRLGALGASAGRIGTALSARSDASKAAMSREEYEPMASAWLDLDRLVSELTTVADQAQEEASALGDLAVALRAQSPSALAQPWAAVKTITDDALRWASQVDGSVDALLAANAVFADLTTALRTAAATQQALEAVEVEATGVAHIPWTVLRDDAELVVWLNRQVLDEGRTAYPAETKRRIGAGLALVVEAERLLAERATEYASAAVAGAADRLEDHYKAVEGYRKEDSQRRRDEAVQRAAVRMRNNMLMQSALLSARESRAALAAGRSAAMPMSRYGQDAIGHFRNAWLHALSSGDAALRALAAPDGN
ncbi:MAG: hypothetical protein FJY74_08125 [Candidatus Eisenbacteria bacterium]|nr:hypothetical protein [Candidatus Eisenbacteria bacterium]